MRYSADDILNYLSGKMSNEEMHALEKEALEDPFLAEALEGMQISHPDTTRENLSDLSQRLQKRIHRKPGRLVPLFPFRWTAVAASFVLLTLGLGAVYLINRIGNKPATLAKQESKDDTRLAATDTTLPIRTDPISKSPYPEGDASTGQRLKKQSEEQADERGVKKRVSDSAMSSSLPPPETESKIAEGATDQAASNPKPLDAARVPVAASEQADPRSRAAPLKLAPAAGTKEGKNNVPDVHFSGQVRATTGAALPFVRITWHPSGDNAYTDAGGRFNLTIPPGQDEATFFAAGFLSKKLMVASGKMDHVIRLESLSASSGARKKTQDPGSNSRIPEFQILPRDREKSFGQPSDGIKAYYAYLANNWRPMNKDRSVSTRGVISISFLVGSSGEITDIRIEQGLDPILEQEAIRMLTEGPAWLPPAGPNGGRTLLTISLE